MKNVIICLMLLLVIKTNAQSIDEKQITHILQLQEAAWNNGNLEKFMHGYWQNDSLMFIGKNGITYGYHATLNNYKKNYPDTAYMGKFTSTILQIKKLSKEYYFVVGKWFLQRSVGNIQGHYTLLFRKIKGEWVIIADHSS
jgi:hypothetical protein